MTEWNARDYYRQSSLQHVMAEEELGLLTLEGTECILDVGCGDGKITAEIATRLPRGSVLGVDPSHEMIAFASSHLGPHGMQTCASRWPTSAVCHTAAHSIS
jgi:trans-aconitate 2-methyltransferase